MGNYIDLAAQLNGICSTMYGTCTVYVATYVQIWSEPSIYCTTPTDACQIYEQIVESSGPGEPLPSASNAGIQESLYYHSSSNRTFKLLIVL